MANKKKQSLKQSNPKAYYARCRRWCETGKFLCSIVPPIVVLTVYAIQACHKGTSTNPFDPLRFGIGMVLLVVGIVLFFVHELRTITKANKKAGNGGVYTSTIAWLFIATILWLFYLTMFYLIIFCFAEVIGTFFSNFLTGKIVRYKELEDKAETAQLNAEALVRETRREETEKKGLPTE